MRRSGVACFALAVFLGLTAAPAVADQIGPDWVASDNVEYLGSIKQDVGMTTGAKIVGKRMFVTSGKNISVYDISKPETPRALGSMKLNIMWQNEEVPTNGKVLAFASDTYSITPDCAPQVVGCVQFFDVETPPTLRRLVPSRSPITRSSARSIARGSTGGPGRSSMRAASSTAGRRELWATG